MSPSHSKLPRHLKKYVVEQSYERYTSEDQAVWRYIMRQLKHFLSSHAHPCYSEGLKKTGISIERIPKIEDMDKKLQEFGWGAVPVSGFIPPAAFMEFQSLGILPIASDMRTIDHLLYTPAPDIVHEAAGHAPILIDPDFAEYLKSYAQVASHAIISKEDLAQYEAIRDLSDLKENPDSTKDQILQAEKKLEKVNASLRFVSEAGLLSRMNWWTAEYGLIGELESPKIFGAGLLSSLGESRECLKPKVKKIPLSVKCVDYTYDITEPQPQLFVTPDFKTLHSVLEDFSQSMAFKQGGCFGLQRAQDSHTVNTVELDSGLQISGLLSHFQSSNDSPIFLKFDGPTQISFDRTQLQGHGADYHAQGYSTPLGLLENFSKPLYQATKSELAQLGISEGETLQLKFESGFVVQGILKSILYIQDAPLIFAVDQCRVTKGTEVYFEPEWGTFDMALGTQVTSVFGGPADRLSYLDTEDFVAARVPSKNYSRERLELFKFYFQLRQLRETDPKNIEQLSQLNELYFRNFSTQWLPAVELYELNLNSSDTAATEKFKQHLLSIKGSEEMRSCIADGIKLAELFPLTEKY